MIYFATETQDDYARAALATEGLSADRITTSGKLLVAHFPADCEDTIRMAHNRVQRRGNVLFEVYGYGRDPSAEHNHQIYLRFQLKEQS